MTAYEARAAAILYNLLLSRGDRRPFLLPANVCPIVPATFREAGQPFHLVDIADPGLSLDEDRCLELVRSGPEGFAGVLFVRTYGNEETDPAPFFQALKEVRPDLLTIDDKCLCRPDLEGGGVSPAADVTLYSTGGRKHVDLGLGGFAHLAEGVPYRRHAAGEEGDWLDLSGPILPREEYRQRVRAALAEADGHKSRVNAVYEEALPTEVCLAPAFQGWRFNLLVPEPDRLIERLFAAGLFASRHYAPLGGVSGRGGFPGAERLHAQVVNLFNDRHFDEERARRAAEAVLRHLAERRHGS
jgi:hypothetical protein